jgi:hypothetical protein
LILHRGALLDPDGNSLISRLKGAAVDGTTLLPQRMKHKFGIRYLPIERRRTENSKTDQSLNYLRLFNGSGNNLFRFDATVPAWLDKSLS